MAVVEIVDGELRGNLGNVRFTLHSRGQDRFQADFASAMEGDGWFQVNGDKSASPTLDRDGRTVAFVR